MKHLTKIVLRVLLMMVALVATSVPLRAADSVVVVTMSRLTFAGTNRTETINISFDWDATTGSVETGTMSVLASGAIGESFKFVSTGSVNGGQGFLWADASGDRVSVNTCGFNCGTFPSIGIYNTVDITLLCGSNDNCSDDGFNGLHPNSGAFTVTTGKLTTLEAIAFNDLNALTTSFLAKVSAEEEVVTTLASQVNSLGCLTGADDLNTLISDLGTLHSDLEVLRSATTVTAVISDLPQLSLALYKVADAATSVQGDFVSCRQLLPDFATDVEDIAGIDGMVFEMIGLVAVATVGLATL